ncbi:unnamed protein product [Prunus armeniaca]
MMMTVLITEDPGRLIDVYLRPLVDELKDLWTNGVRTYNKSTWKMFILRAAVMWTVNDFSAYAMVSGWSTKGYMACPVCKEDVLLVGKREKFVILVIGDGCHGTTSGGKRIKSLTGTQSIASDLENGSVMRSWNSLTIWIFLHSRK